MIKLPTKAPAEKTMKYDSIASISFPTTIGELLKKDYF
jgi:hypothetical protein